MLDVLAAFAWAFLALCVIIIVLTAFLRRVGGRQPDDALIDVGGIKMVGYEALMGAAIAVILVASVTVHAVIRDENREAQKLETLLRWHPGLKLERGALPWAADVVAEALTNAALQEANPELAAMVSEAATSLGNRHCLTSASLASSWVLTLSLVTALMIFALAHAILTSLHLTGLRILMPVMVFSLLACVLAVAFDFYKYARTEASIVSCQPIMSAK